ncbi:MAG: hypothetical protein ABIS20_08125 [Thermoanaerobaculia bacterium]
MQKRILAALTVLLLGLGLMAGPHPCSGQQSENGQPKASCHGQGSGTAMAGMGMNRGAHAASPRANLPAHGHHGPANCCDTFCQHACQVPAIAAAQPVAFAIEPVALAVVEPSDPGLPLLAHPLDHVPLA